MPTKRRSQQMHVQRRSLERLGYIISRESLDRIIKDIQRGDAEFVDRQSNRVTRWRVQHNDHTICVVYDSKRKMLCTVLPEGAF